MTATELTKLKRRAAALRRRWGRWLAEQGEAELKKDKRREAHCLAKMSEARAALDEAEFKLNRHALQNHIGGMVWTSVDFHFMGPRWSWLGGVTGRVVSVARKFVTVDFGELGREHGHQRLRLRINKVEVIDLDED